MVENNVKSTVKSTVNGKTIGELDGIETNKIKSTDLFAVETDLSTNAISIEQVKNFIENALMQKSTNLIGTFVLHPAPDGTNGISAKVGGYGDVILPCDGRELSKNEYPELYNYIIARKGLDGFKGENQYCFRLDEFVGTVRLPNIQDNSALYGSASYGYQSAIFPNHRITMNQTDVDYDDTSTIQDQNYTLRYSNYQDTDHNLLLKTRESVGRKRLSFTPNQKSIENLPNGISLGDDMKVAGVRMIVCIYVKPSNQIVVGTGGGGGGGGGITYQDLDMLGYAIKNIGNPTEENDAIRLKDLNGFVKADRSISLLGEGAFNTKYPAAMEDLKSKNITVAPNETLEERLISINNSLSSSTTFDFKLLEYKYYQEGEESINATLKYDSMKGYYIYAISKVSGNYNSTTEITPYGLTATCLDNTGTFYANWQIIDAKKGNVIVDGGSLTFVKKSDVKNNMVYGRSDIYLDSDEAKSFSIKDNAFMTNPTWICDNASHIPNKKQVETIVDSKIALLDIQTLSNKITALDRGVKSWGYDFKKTLTLSIPSSPTALTNLTGQFPSAIMGYTLVQYGISLSGLVLQSPQCLLWASSGASAGFKIKFITGMQVMHLSITVRINGTITGNAGTARELVVYLRRIRDNSIVSNAGIIKINDNDFNGRGTTINSYVNGELDTFMVDGFYLDILNNSGATVNITQLQLLVQGY